MRISFAKMAKSPIDKKWLPPQSALLHKRIWRLHTEAVETFFQQIASSHEYTPIISECCYTYLLCSTQFSLFLERVKCNDAGGPARKSMNQKQLILTTQVREAGFFQLKCIHYILTKFHFKSMENLLLQPITLLELVSKLCKIVFSPSNNVYWNVQSSFSP